MADAVLMDEPLVARLPESFWKRMRDAPARLLMIDYDGTLVPFRVERMEARPSPESYASLQKLVESGHTRVVIVSGRPAEEVAMLLGGLPVTIVGAHGFERFEHLEGTRKSTLTSDETDGLAAADAAARATGLEARIEIKPASVAMHTRGMGHDEAHEAEELAWNVWTPIAERHGLECRTFAGGVEIRSRHYHKGIAVETLLEEMPADVFAVYVGDDDTDEDAFRVLAGRGTGIKVGDPDGQTEAQWRLPDPEAVREMLDHWQAEMHRTVAPAVSVRTPARLIVVSNRLPSFEAKRKPDKTRRGKAAGGLATAVAAALKHTGGGMWIGWTGKTSPRRDARQLRPVAEDPLPILGIDLSDREVDAYYNGFCNHALWPLLHSFQSHVSLSTFELEVYRDVNQAFAQSIRPLLSDGDLVWIHDYHLIHVGAELRRLGFQGRIGFFLHVPFPSLDFLAILPEYHTFVEALAQDDVIGFHTRTYLDNYLYACLRILDAEWDGSRLRAGGRTQRAGVYPAGIDPERFVPSEDEDGSPVRRRSLKGMKGEGRLMIGVDRLDYTKGIPERLIAMEHLLKIWPELRGRVTMLQICAPSRQRVPEYIEQKRAMDALVGRLNAELGEHDWEPIRYLYRSYAQSDLASFYREAEVGLVTPLRDGMNLVAKEFVAAQRPEEPGVLVLSRFAGASEELTEAVMVNPYLPEDCARGIAEALSMPRGERIERHRAMLAKVTSQTAQKWAADFLRDLSASDP